MNVNEDLSGAYNNPGLVDRVLAAAALVGAGIVGGAGCSTTPPVNVENHRPAENSNHGNSSSVRSGSSTGPNHSYDDSEFAKRFDGSGDNVPYKGKMDSPGSKAATSTSPSGIGFDAGLKVSRTSGNVTDGTDVSSRAELDLHGIIIEAEGSHGTGTRDFKNVEEYSVRTQNIEGGVLVDIAKLAGPDENMSARIGLIVTHRRHDLNDHFLELKETNATGYGVKIDLRDIPNGLRVVFKYTRFDGKNEWYTVDPIHTDVTGNRIEAVVGYTIPGTTLTIYGGHVRQVTDENERSMFFKNKTEASRSLFGAEYHIKLDDEGKFALVPHAKYTFGPTDFDFANRGITGSRGYNTRGVEAGFRAELDVTKWLRIIPHAEVFENRYNGTKDQGWKAGIDIDLGKAIKEGWNTLFGK